MSIYNRDNNRILFQYESGTYATPSGASGNWIGLVTSHAPTENENVMEIRYAGTSNRNFGQLVNGPKDYEGTITYHPQDFRMFAFAMGSCVDAATGKHTISELNSNGMYAPISGTSNLTNFPSITILDSKKGLADGQNLVRTLKGAVIDKFTMTVSQNEPVECEVSYKAQSYTLGSKTTDIVNILDEDTTRPYIWSDGVFTMDTVVMNELNKFEYTLENNVENRHYVNGSLVTQAMVPTMRNHTISIETDATSSWGKTFSDYHKNGSVFNATMVMTQSATELGKFIYSGCKITEMNEPSEVEGIDTYSVTVRPQTVTFIGSDAKALYNIY